MQAKCLAHAAGIEAEGTLHPFCSLHVEVEVEVVCKAQGRTGRINLVPALGIVLPSPQTEKRTYLYFRVE